MPDIKTLFLIIEHIKAQLQNVRASGTKSQQLEVFKHLTNHYSLLNQLLREQNVSKLPSPPTPPSPPKSA